MKKGDTIACAVCGKEFIAQRHNHKYCCEKCKYEGNNRQMLLRKKLYREEKKKKKKAPADIMPWSEVIAICNKHNISYGKAKSKGLVR